MVADYRPKLHPLAGSRIDLLLKIFRLNGFPSRHYAKDVGKILLSCLLRHPFALLEDARVRMARRKNVGTPAPVFIVGHWRSGTTLLHRILSRDPQYCWPTFLEAVSPYDFLYTPLHRVSLPFLQSMLPRHRPMDDVPVALSEPQEHDLALAAMGAPSFMNCFYFPADRRRQFEDNVLFDCASPSGRIWTDALNYYVSKLSVANHGKRPLLKSPADALRIGMLRQIFPGARFIHLHRHPYEVFWSTVKLYETMTPLLCLQTPDRDSIVEHVGWSYIETMTRIRAQIAGVGSPDLINIGYEDLCDRPTETIRRIYGALGLGRFECAAMDEVVAEIRPASRGNRSKPPESGRYRKIGRWLGYTMD